MEAIRDLIRQSRPGVSVRIAYLDLMQPTLAEALQELHGQGHSSVVIAPMFLAPGGHVTRDLPHMIADAKKRLHGLEVHVLPTLGEDDQVLHAIAALLADKLSDGIPG
jgi:sirohydrochlorin ferrochelatase